MNISVPDDVGSVNRHQWLEGLYQFASPGLQNLWVTGHDEVMVTFVECMEVYFGSRLGLSNGCEHAISEGWMSEIEAEIAEDFHKVARDYISPFDRAGLFRRTFTQHRDSDVLADPQWEEVVRAAQQAWLRLKMVISDPVDVKQMAEDERRWGKITEGPN
jgi:hypothetical protein